MKAKYSQPMSGEKVEDRSTKTAGARISASEAARKRHSRTRQRHRHPKPKTLRCLPSPPSVSPPSAPPCASRAAPPSPRCVSRDAPIEDSCHARTLSRMSRVGRARNAPTTRCPSATNTAGRGQYSEAQGRCRVLRRTGAFAARGGRGAPFPERFARELGVFFATRPVSTSKTGGWIARATARRARGRRSPTRTALAHDPSRSRVVRSRSETRASPRSRRRERASRSARIRSRTTRRPTDRCGRSLRSAKDVFFQRVLR